LKGLRETKIFASSDSDARRWRGDVLEKLLLEIAQPIIDNDGGLSDCVARAVRFIASQSIAATPTRPKLLV
jgi:hypothetical protein